MSSNPHHDWAVVVKNADKDFPGATIQTAYCNCTADLGGYCNYIAVFLFRVKSFIITGKTTSSRTSQLYESNVPWSTKVDITLLAAKEIMVTN